MAKLSARGRTELARIEKIEKPDADGVIYRTQRVLMSDGWILRKGSWKRPGERWEGGGWKQDRKYTGDLDVIKKGVQWDGTANTREG